MASLEQARAAKNSEQIKNISRRRDVNGIGICNHTQGYALKINLLQADTENGSLPTSVDGVPIVTDSVGPAEPAI